MPIGSAMATAPRHVSPVRNPLRHRPSSPLNPLAARLHSAAHIHATTATAITTVVSTRTHLSNLDRLLQKKQPVAPPPPPQPAPDPVVEDDRDPRDSPFSFSVLHRTGSCLLNALNLPSALFLPSSSTQQAEEISPRSLTHLRRLLSNSNRQSPRGVIAPRWHQYHGAADWDGLLDPLDHDLRRELIRYGEFAQATYHAFHSNPTAAPPDRPRAVVLPDRSYRVTRNLFATASVELPPWVDTVAPWMMTATPTSWVGYVAVCDNEREIQRMGRRDIVIALRGTSTCLEWAENFRTWLVPIDEEEQEAEEEESSEGEQTEKPRGTVPKVECGFRSLFKTAGPDAPSLSSMVAEEVRRLMEQYAGEELSITVVGHSLGAALAVLVADELAASVSPHVPTAVFSFGGPRVGNQAFADRVERRAVKVLRVVNAHDLVTRVPWVLPARTDGYAHVGRELRVDNRMSPYLRPDADAVRIRSPIPYRIRKFGQKLLPYGMNFAVAGSGIFDTGNFQSNLTVQIDKFQAQIDDGVFSRHDLKSSAALIAVSGNDYQFLSELDPDYLHHLRGFMHRLFAQLKVDLKRLSHIGVPKVIVTNLHPIGCIPSYTRPTNYTACYSNVSSAVAEHNRRVDELMQELGGGSDTTFLSLDVNTAFLNVLHRAKGAKEIKHPLVPCCVSRSNTTECGEIDAEGNRLYGVCRRPEEHFYWDSVHPTQAGWAAAFEFLRPSLREFLQL